MRLIWSNLQRRQRGCQIHQVRLCTAQRDYVASVSLLAPWVWNDTKIIEGSLEVKLPTIWTHEKQRWEESEKRREEKRREEKRREEKIKKRKSPKKEDPGARKGGKVAKHCVFPMICGSGGSKSRLAKAAGAEPAGQMRDGQLHVVVARNTCRNQNVQNTPGLDHFLKLRCRKSARRCGTKHISISKCTKHTRFRPLFEVEMSKKCTPLWRKAHVEVKSAKNSGVRNIFGRSDVVLRGRRKGLWTLPKVSKTWGFYGISKNDGRRGAFEEDLQRCIFRGRRSIRDIFIRDVGRSGRWFPKRGCILEHEIFGFAKMILRDKCSTSYDLASLFRGRCSTLGRWSGKTQNALVRGHQLCTQLSIFEGRLADLFRSNIEEVSQTCFVFGIVKFRIWGSLAELFCFWRCQVQKLRKSRKIALSYRQIDR